MAGPGGSGSRCDVLRLGGVNAVGLHWERLLLLRSGGGCLGDDRLGLWNGLWGRLGRSNRSRRGSGFANRFVDRLGGRGGSDR